MVGSWNYWMLQIKDSCFVNFRPEMSFVQIKLVVIVSFQATGQQLFLCTFHSGENNFYNGLKLFLMPSLPHGSACQIMQRKYCSPHKVSEPSLPLSCAWANVIKRPRTLSLLGTLKEKVTPKSVYFLSSPIKSLYWVKLLTEVSASKVHAIPRN